MQDTDDTPRYYPLKTRWKGQSMPDEPFLPYVRSPQFRTVFADGAVSILLSDTISDRLLISFTRLDILPVGEKAKSVRSDRIEVIAGTIPETQSQKTLEVTLDVRPDIALARANNILMTLANFSNDRKAIYGIPTTVAPITAVPPRAR